MPTQKERVVAYLQKQVWGTMAATKISKDLKIPYASLTRCLSELFREKKVTKFWNGKITVYEIVKHKV